jgi:hypothetical protein
VDREARVDQEAGSTTGKEHLSLGGKQLKTMADKNSVIELPATVDEIKNWLDSLPADTQVEASTFNSFRKATGQVKVQRLIAHLNG